MHLRLPAALALSLACLAAPAHALPYNELYVFGDSLSDAGNFYLASGGIAPASPPYSEGRFSNGPTYAERLAEQLGLDLSPSLAGGNDFAYGAARTDSNSYIPGGDVLSQVDSYLARGDAPGTDALFVVFAGANNLQDAIMAAAMDPLNALAIKDAQIANAIADLRAVLETLAAAGAEHIVVPNTPDLGLIPMVTSFGSPLLNGFATAVSAEFNQALAGVLAELSGPEIISFDTFTLTRAIVSQPGQYGFTNVTEPCYFEGDLDFMGGGTLCANPQDYFFWDTMHPTARVHTLFADGLFAAIPAAVPEPESLPLFGLGLLGLGLAHVAGRRSKRWASA